MICLHARLDAVEWECCECREDAGGAGCNLGTIAFDEGIWSIANGVAGDVVPSASRGWRHDGWRRRRRTTGYILLTKSLGHCCHALVAFEP